MKSEAIRGRLVVSAILWIVIVSLFIAGCSFIYLDNGSILTDHSKEGVILETEDDL